MTIFDQDAPTEPPPPVSPASAAVRIRGVSKTYSKVRAVDNIDLDIPHGAVFGLIGPNGAGKTTTFAVLATLLLPTSGEVRILGEDPISDPRSVRRMLGYMPDTLGVYTDLDVDEYLRFFASSYKIPAARHDAILDGLLELVALGRWREARVNSLSRGMKQRLSLARALVHDPEILVLDEPASGLDPRARSELRGLLHQLSTMGKTIVISSHILSELQDVCTHVGIMDRGKVKAAGRTDQILSGLHTTRHLQARFADGSVEVFEVSDDSEQAALLTRLVDGGRSPVEFTQVGGGLEELFLSITGDADQ
jgi:ABC-2 type transport system ATP-binding protein